MKQVLNFAPTFTPASKTLNFSGYTGFSAKRLLAVINETQTQVIYAAGATGLGYSSISGGNILTLTFNTTGHNSADVLTVLYDEVDIGLASDTAATDATSSWSAIALLKYLTKFFLGTTVKAASTAAVATDPALVVAISPNGQPANGIATSANSRPFVSASDDVNIGPIVTVVGSVISAVNQNVIGPTDVSQYRGAYFHLTVAGTGCSFFVQGSNDNSTWYSVSAQDVGVPTASIPNSQINSSKLVYIPLGFRYLRIQCGVYGSGSPTGIICYSPTALTTAPMFALGTTPQPVTTIGPTGFAHGTNTAAAVINANIKSSSANLSMASMSNANATTKFYFKFFNKASTATLGTDTPVWTVVLMPASTISLDIGPFSQRFSNGLTVVATAAYADLDTSTITAAGDVSYNIGYN